mgnify:FL=1
MKKKGNISIKAKLLGIIIPVVIAIILILVFTAYHVSSGIIESYSKNLLESSVSNQASKIEAWLDETNRIVSFHEIPDSRYYSTEASDFWQRITSLILAGYRVQ